MTRKRIVIVDGYNAIHRVPELEAQLDKSLEQARRAAVALCSEWLATRRDVWMFYIVFDGSSDVLDGNIPTARGVRVIYTRSDESADDRIIALAKEHEHTYDCVVVSDDRYVRNHSEDFQAEIMTVADFHSTVRKPKRRRVPGSRSGSKTGLSPKQEKDITDGLRQAWGLDD